MGSATYTPIIDEWSTGCITLEMLTGRCPLMGRVEVYIYIHTHIHGLHHSREAHWPVPTMGRVEVCVCVCVCVCVYIYIYTCIHIRTYATA